MEETQNLAINHWEQKNLDPNEKDYLKIFLLISFRIKKYSETMCQLFRPFILKCCIFVPLIRICVHVKIKARISNADLFFQQAVFNYTLSVVIYNSWSVSRKCIACSHASAK